LGADLSILGAKKRFRGAWCSRKMQGQSNYFLTHQGLHLLSWTMLISSELPMISSSTTRGRRYFYEAKSPCVHTKLNKAACKISSPILKILSSTQNWKGDLWQLPPTFNSSKTQKFR
jgi:hypothetical protein